MSDLTKEQAIQEEEYSKPYHYFIERQSRIGNFYFSYIDKCLEIVNSFTGKRVLDAGCGDGFFISKLDSSKNEIFGLDYSDRALEFAKVFCKDGIALKLGDLIKMPFENSFFDIVTNIAVLEHIKPEEVNDCLMEISRILKNDGLLILAIPTPNLEKLGKHFQHFTSDRISKLLAPYFTIEKMYGCCNQLYDYIIKPFSNRSYDIKFISDYLSDKVFYPYFARSPLSKAKMLIIVAKKLHEIH